MLILGAAIAFRLNPRRPWSVAIPIYGAALMAACVMLTTTQAAPIMLSSHRIGSDPATLQQAFEDFYRWDSIRAVFGALEGCAELWALVALRSVPVGSQVLVHQNIQSTRESINNAVFLHCWTMCVPGSNRSQTLLHLNGIGMLLKSSAFFSMLGVHILAGVICVVTGIVTMASEKRPGLHPICGTIYHRGLAVLVVSAVFLAATDWTNDRVLLVIGAISLGASYLGRMARRRRWQAWVGTHITSMGCSFIAMLTAFCVEEGKSLPGLSRLPRLSYWFLPALVGAPLIIQAVVRYRRSRSSEKCARSASGLCPRRS